MNRPFSRSSSFGSNAPRINGKIRAREVRVIGPDGGQLGVLSLGDAINLARSRGVDLVEVAPEAQPPVCRLVDYGKYRYEQSKKEKHSRKHQHANKVKEIQLRPGIDPHDFGVKLGHAIEFLCEEMKVKVTLKFRGREMAHKEFGYQQIEKFLKEIAPYGHPDAPPSLVGKGINVMISPLPRNKRGKPPGATEGVDGAPARPAASEAKSASAPAGPQAPAHKQAASSPAKPVGSNFANNPFEKLNLPPGGKDDEKSS